MPPVLKPHTFRSESYKAFIRTKRCLICNNPDTVAHHEGLGLNMVGSKPPDSHCLPLCVPCHTLRHSYPTGLFWDMYPFVDVKMTVISLMTEYLEQLEK